MANPLYEQMNRGWNDIMAQFNAFRQSFNGNPQQVIQNMLNSGKITQAQLNSAMQKANQMAKMFGIK